MKEFFDELETRSDDLRSREQFERLRKQVHHLKAHVPAYSDRLKDIDPESVIDRDTLGLLPVTRKSELAQAQSENPPLGGFSDLTGRSMLRIFASPGAILSHRPMSRIFGERHARFSRRGVEAAIWSITRFPITLPRPVLCSRAARTKSAAPCFLRVLDRANCKFRRLRTLSHPFTWGHLPF